MLFLEVIKEIARVGGYVATGLYTLAAIAQLYYPLWRLGRLGVADPEEAVGLRPARPWFDLKLALLLSLIAFVPFIFGHHWFWTQGIELLRPGAGMRFSPALPKDPLTLVLTHFLGVALPEEVFYRGFVQPRMRAAFLTRRWRILGADCGWEIPLTSAIFALGHFAGEYDPMRLGPFFPGLVFGWLRARTGSVYGAIIFHALSNVLSAFLWACYR
ncbi:MAG: CPBP family intramembrane metalloprotease [Deltaproteobacteria bacterium]|nr:CPBP family intramembrane metalloprotease [Deltaproteobacteria bacterium]